LWALTRSVAPRALFCASPIHVAAGDDDRNVTLRIPRIKAMTYPRLPITAAAGVVLRARYPLFEFAVQPQGLHSASTGKASVLLMVCIPLRVRASSAFADR